MSDTNLDNVSPPDKKAEDDKLAAEREDPFPMFRSPLVVIMGFLSLVALLACYVLLEMNGKSTNSFLGFIVGIAAIVPGTAAYTAAKSVKRDSLEIKRQTNGPLTKTHETVVNVEDRLSSLEDNIKLLTDQLSVNNTQHKEQQAALKSVPPQTLL